MRRRKCDVIGCDNLAILPYAAGICSRCWDLHVQRRIDLTQDRMLKSMRKTIEGEKDGKNRGKR